MRGKVCWTVGIPDSPRITPAYAGKSLICSINHRLREDHPRLCGEKSMRLIPDVLLLGSPPPMRGKEWHIQGDVLPYRITPAYAGKSLYCLTIAVKPSGSPPPMRGKVSERNGAFWKHRITPAYAGKRQVHIPRIGILKDHPRLCGEKSICYDSTRPCLGSPPPMRGKVYGVAGRRGVSRITPAYAGKSAPLLRWSGGVWDHPRLCGEKGMVLVFHLNSLGSPPPMRGKGDGVAGITQSTGITPAYAGKSSGEICGYNGYKDHPRLCGEKLFFEPRFHTRIGSPPPMRGKGIPEGANVVAARITPAYAGKSRKEVITC